MFRRADLVRFQVINEHLNESIFEQYLAFLFLAEVKENQLEKQIVYCKRKQKLEFRTTI